MANNNFDINSLKAAFKTPERSGTGLPNNYFPFWQMKEGEQAVIRFLPDAVDNPMGFMVEKVMHNLDINGERKSVPCLSMYGESCPICAVSQEFYKKEDKANGKKYWKKKQYITQALVVKDPLPVKDGEESHAGKVRFITLGYSLFKIIKDVFESGELTEVPFAYKGGTDFIVKKDMQGEYPSYILSNFSRTSTDLDDEVIDNLDLSDLSALLPKNPGLEKVEAMLEAALSGGTYSEDDNKPAAKRPAPTPKAEPVKAEESKVSESKDDEDVDEDVEKLLAEIKGRRANKK